MPDEDKTNEYVVFARPNLMEFLDYIFDNYKVLVWTAASEDYAIWIVRNILSLSKTSIEPVHRNIELLLSCDHCDISHDLSNGKHKDLNLLYDEFELNKTNPEIFNDNAIFVLFDDSSTAQKSNLGTNQPLHRCVPIKPFELDDNGQFDTKDDILLQIIQHLDKNPEKLFSRTFSIN